MTRVLDLPTSLGPGRAHIDVAPHEGSGPVLVLGHGAGGGSTARDLEALAAALPDLGIHVVRVDQPWRVAGRRVAPAPTTLDVAWRQLVPAVSAALGRTAGPLVLGGRSAGARVACRTAGELGAVGVVALAFPLHPPGRPEVTRAGELTAGVPLLVMQGSRDSFGTPAQFPAGVDVREVPGADHGMRVAARSLPGQADVLRELGATVGAWITGLAT